MDLKTILPSLPSRNECNAQFLAKASVADFNRLYREDAAFREYATKVYDYLEQKMQPGTKINLQAYHGQKLEWTLLTYAAFIEENLHWLEFYISDDYNYICRPYQSRELVELLREMVIKDRRKKSVKPI